MSKPTVREQQTKCKGLRAALVEYVNARPGEWVLGGTIADEVLGILHRRGVSTFSNVLSKELRKAERLGEITKRKRPGTVYVEYTANPPSGMLLDNSITHHGEDCR